MPRKDYFMTSSYLDTKRTTPRDESSPDQLERGVDSVIDSRRKLNVIRFSELDYQTESKKLVAVPKIEKIREMITKAISDSPVLSQYENLQKQTILDLMYEKVYGPNEYLIRKGNMSACFVVITAGKAELQVDNCSFQIGPGDSFGDSSLMRPELSKFSIRSTEVCTAWVIDARGFHVENTKLESIKTDKTIKLLKEVPLFNSLTQSQLHILCNSLVVEKFKDNDYIIRKGDIGTKFYIVKSGIAICYGDHGNANNKTGSKVELRRLQVNDFFGEIALLQKITRTIDVVSSGTTECWVLKQEIFDGILGSLEEILQQNMKRRLLDSTSVLAPLKSEERQQLVPYVEIVNYKQDEYVLHDYEFGNKFYILEKGEAKIVDGSDKILRHLGEGDHFGESALLQVDGDIIYNVVAKTDLTVLTIKREIFINILGNYDKLVEKNLREELINSMTFFGNNRLTLTAQEQLINNSKTMIYHQDDDILNVGDLPSSFYIIETGSVESIGKTSIILTKGSYFGEKALLSLQPQKYHIRALEYTKLLVIDKFSFYDIIQPLLYKLTDLVVDSILGVGGFAIVLKVHAINSHDTSFALKKISKTKFHSNSSVQAIKNEKYLLFKISHPFVIKLVTTYQDDSFVYFLEEYTDAGDIRTLLLQQENNCFKEQQAKFYSAIMVQALEHLHNMHIVYRDLKPENILLCSNGYVKLCDLGNAKEVIDRTYSHVGTADYMPPEICLDRGHSIACDFWIFGVVVYEFLYGKTPFEGLPNDDPREQMTRILKCKVMYPSSFSSEATDFIKNLLKSLPEQRLGCLIGKCNDIRNHPWLKSINFDNLMKFKIPAPFIPSQDYIDLCQETFQGLAEDDFQDILIDQRTGNELKWIEDF